MPKQAEAQVNVAGPDPQPRPKKNKKKKDRASKPQPESALGVSTANRSYPDAEPAMDAAASLKANKKKKAKRLKAAAEAQQQQVVSMPAAEAAAQAPPRKKQKKGSAQAGSAGGEVQASMAEVGDRELARLGKPIRKALYSEDPAVAAMSSAEVDAGREERSTVVTGCDIRPVPAFEQAGAWATLTVLAMCSTI